MRNDDAFYFVMPSTLLEQVRQIAEKNSISMSAFIRQSLKRNLSAYATYDHAMATALSRTAQQRSAQ